MGEDSEAQWSGEDDSPRQTSKPLATPVPRRNDRQSERLARESIEVQRAFAYHPRVRVVPLPGDPASEFQVTYRVRTVQLDEEGQPGWTDRVEMHVWLPPEYPDAPPLFRPLSPVFHPNISAEGVVGLPPWEPRLSLSHVITQVGFALAYRTFNKEVIVDEAALAWTEEAAENIPTDPEADFFSEVGGKPLARISENGAKTLARLRQSVVDACQSLLQEVPPAEGEIVRFCQATRQLLPMFLSDDLPAELKSAAQEIDEGVRLLPDALAQFDLMRRQHVAVTALAREAREAAVIARKLDDRRAELDAAYQFNLSGDIAAAAALAQIPEPAALKPLEAELARQIEPAERWLASLRSRQQALEKPLVIDASLGALLNDRLGAAMAEIEQGLVPARADAAAGVEVLAPAVAAAQGALASLQRCIQWKNYAELLERGIAMEQRMRGRDITTVQAFYIDTASGSFGPFELEQKVTLGSAAVTVRSRGRRTIDVLDARSGRTLGRGDSGKVSVEIKDAASGESYPYVFRVTHRADDLRSQIKHAAKRTAEMLAKLMEPLAPADSQFGVLVKLLDQPEARAAFEARQREAETCWAALIADLGEIEPLKERLATYFLVKRYLDSIPEVLERMQKARALVRQAMGRLSQINSQSSKSKSGQLMVPSEFAAEHGEMTRLRSMAEPEVERLQKRIDKAVLLIQHRLAHPKLWGAARYPALTVLAPMSPELSQTMMDAADEKILDMILKMEESLNVSLRPVEWIEASEDSEAAVEEAAQEPDLIEASQPESAQYAEPITEEVVVEEEQEAAAEDEILGDWPGVQ